MKALVYEFGEFHLDPANHLLSRSDGTQVPLTPRVFDTLLFIVEHHGTALDKERLMEAVWPDSIVEENNLSQNISTLRRIFGDTPGSHRFIVTVPGRGYRFAADVTILDDNLKETEKSLAVAGGQLAQGESHSADVASRSWAWTISSKAACSAPTPGRCLVLFTAVLPTLIAFVRGTPLVC